MLYSSCFIQLYPFSFTEIKQGKKNQHLVQINLVCNKLFYVLCLNLKKLDSQWDGQ